MKRQQQGLSLIELMISLALGLIIVLGVTQAFISAKNTYLTQNAASAMQEDARYLLTRMSQEIRMTGMFGCLATITAPTTSPALFTAAQATPISWTVDATNGNRLMLVTADVGSAGTTPTWTVVSDCLTNATAYNGAAPAAAAAAAGNMSFLLRQVYYSFRSNTIFTGAVGAQQPLISNVGAFGVLFGLASDATSASVTSYVATPTTAQMEMIRTIRLTLTMTDPNGRVADQTYSVVAAMRNRLQ
ncbi:prepilin-type N-terminal cleavage/methylation domain-containing protein [Pseudomonas sp. RIT-PI-S]|uniref:PilW family protein n=1 Tax=Pseudomonas sp. RIT-PI-S TaxID=3035295 RepID=UPI0021DA7B44|nr:prepilin-type N-terminal cleavage/methylation domain-containing protein [Pseudomonas sp. RIT-PI-S]